MDGGMLLPWEVPDFQLTRLANTWWRETVLRLKTIRHVKGGGTVEGARHRFYRFAFWGSLDVHGDGGEGEWHVAVEEPRGAVSVCWKRKVRLGRWAVGHHCLIREWSEWNWGRAWCLWWIAWPGVMRGFQILSTYHIWDYKMMAVYIIIGMVWTATDKIRPPIPNSSASCKQCWVVLLGYGLTSYG